MLHLMFCRAGKVSRWTSRLWREEAFRDAQRTLANGNAGGEVLWLPNSESSALVKLPNRTWGPVTSLALDTVLRLTGGHRVQSLAVARQAFVPHTEPPQKLSEALCLASGNAVAIASTAQKGPRRWLVDKYELGAHGYRLQASSEDLMKYVQGSGLSMFLAGDLHGVLNAGSVFKSNGYAAACKGSRQSTNHILMVAPTAFGFNQQAAEDNTFMAQDGGQALLNGDNVNVVTETILKEFSGLYNVLTERAGMKVTLFDHSEVHGTPDAVFPNNWFSTHGRQEAPGSLVDRSLVLYPMKCPNRRLERRPEMLEYIRTLGYVVELDMTAHEKEGRYLEGTGALVLDRVNGIAYVAASERADISVAEEWAQRCGYNEVVSFHSVDERGMTVYHTNVMMALGTDVALVCADSVEDGKEREHLLGKLKQHHKVIEISRRQMGALCGNVLELQDGRGLPVMAASTAAWRAFTPDQKKDIGQCVAGVYHAPIDLIEKIGGGGVRCTIAELF
eukprot:evm.model.scf_906EXC.1 EVM.evm.TU.scf_906EXC.1   scf_906EXC:3950-9498(-)